MIKKLSLAKNQPWLALAVLVSSQGLYADTVSLPYAFPRTPGSNLLTNPSFNGATGWSINYSAGPADPSKYMAQYDSSVTRTTGSGSIKFSPRPGGGTQQWTSVLSDFFVVGNGTGEISRDKTYTISFYAKMDNPNSYLQVTLQQFEDLGGGVKKRLDQGSYSTGGVVGVSTAGEWQEITAVVKVTDPTVTHVKVYIGVTPDSPASSMADSFYIDDVYMGEGISFAEQPSTVRNSFPRVDLGYTGDSYVKVDALGNWSVRKGSVWSDFFPFGIYANLARTTFDVYAEQGLNTALNLNFMSQVQMAKNAGMHAGLRLAKYANEDWEIEDQPHSLTYWTLETSLTYLANNPGLNETLLCYEWDNEHAWPHWERWQDMAAMIRDHDQTHPIYQLNGQAGGQRVINQLIDVAGTYVSNELRSDSYYDEAGGIGRFEILQNQEKQTAPASIAQITNPEDTVDGMRVAVYDALIKGARGIMLLSNPELKEVQGLDDPIENRAWWGSVLDLSNELKTMTAMLREAATTTWSVSSSDNKVKFTTRSHRGEGYMIVLNDQNVSTTTTFSLSGFAPNTVLNFVKRDERVASVNGSGQFTVTLPAHGTAVYHLVKEVLVNGDMENGGSWGVSKANPGDTVGLVGSPAYANTQSVQLHNDTTTGDSHYYQLFSPLSANTKYRFSAMVKTDDVVKSAVNDYQGAIVQLYAGGKNMFPPLPVKAGLEGDHDWELIESDFTTLATPTSSDWYIRLRLWNASGTAWYDNVSVRQLLLP